MKHNVMAEEDPDLSIVIEGNQVMESQSLDTTKCDWTSSSTALISSLLVSFSTLSPPPKTAMFYYPTLLKQHLIVQ